MLFEKMFLELFLRRILNLYECWIYCIGRKNFGQIININGHGQTGKGPNDDEVSPTTQKKDSSSYANVVRGTKRFVRPEWGGSTHSI